MIPGAKNKALKIYHQFNGVHSQDLCCLPTKITQVVFSQMWLFKAGLAVSAERTLFHGIFCMCGNEMKTSKHLINGSDSYTLLVKCKQGSPLPKCCYHMLNVLFGSMLSRDHWRSFWTFHLISMPKCNHKNNITIS